MTLFLNSLIDSTVLANQIAATPGFIVGPISTVFGYVIDFLFNLVFNVLGPAHSLGITIILITIIFRMLLLPLTLKGQRSMAKMREIKPELDKIQAKYGNSKDPEIMKKANAERSAVMAKHGANPLSGCLPMLVQMPLFIGLNFIMHQAFLYISRLNEVYRALAEAIIRVPGVFDANGVVRRLATPLVPDRMHNAAVQAQDLLNQGYSMEAVREMADEFIVMSDPADLSRVLNRFTPENWQYLFDNIPAEYLPDIMALQAQLVEIETFFGLSMIANTGLGWPGILIPIICVLTMLTSTWLMQLRMNDPNATDQQKMQQKIMLVVMPVIMAVMTVQFPAGVGLFWVTGQIIAVTQEIIMNRKEKIPFRFPWQPAEA